MLVVRLKQKLTQSPIFNGLFRSEDLLYELTRSPSVFKAKKTESRVLNLLQAPRFASTADPNRFQDGKVLTLTTQSPKSLDCTLRAA